VWWDSFILLSFRRNDKQNTFPEHRVHGRCFLDAGYISPTAHSSGEQRASLAGMPSIYSI
jgi:hypothetical protein